MAPRLRVGATERLNGADALPQPALRPYAFRNEGSAKGGAMFETGCDEAEQALIGEARRFAEDKVAPVIEDWEARRAMPEALLREAGGRFGGLLVPEAMGGRGARVRVAASVLAALARADLAFGFSLVVHINLAAALARGGSEAQRARYLPALLSGETIGAFCLTEPETGSDPAAITTAARPEGAGWRLDGEKAWVTNAACAGLFNVFARQGDGPGSKVMGSFLVERGDSGLEIGPAYAMLGCHVMGAGGLRLSGVRIGPERAFAPVGEGFRAAMRGIDLARILLSAMCCAILDDALETARRSAASRRAFGAPTIDRQGVLFPLADAATALRAAQLLTEEAIGLLDSGGDARLAAAHAKKASTRAAFTGIAAAMQAMGGLGFRRESRLPRHLEAAKMAEYLDGTTEIQNVVIGRALAGS